MSIEDAANALRNKVNALLQDQVSLMMDEVPKVVSARRYTKCVQTDSVEPIVERALAAQASEFARSKAVFERDKLAELRGTLRGEFECEKSHFQEQLERHHAEVIHELRQAHSGELTSTIKRMQTDFNSELTECVQSERIKFMRAQHEALEAHMQEMNSLRESCKLSADLRVQQAVDEVKKSHACATEDLIAEHASQMQSARDKMVSELRSELEQQSEILREQLVRDNHLYLESLVNQLAEQNQKHIEERRLEIKDRTIELTKQVDEMSEQTQYEATTIRKLEAERKECQSLLQTAQAEVVSLKQALEVARVTFDTVAVEIQGKVKAVVDDKNREICRLEQYIHELERQESPRSCIIRTREILSPANLG